MTTTELETRTSALTSFTEYGPTYTRGVSRAIADARRCFGWGEMDRAEYWMRQAEVYAGVRPVEELNQAFGSLF